MKISVSSLLYGLLAVKAMEHIEVGSEESQSSSGSGSRDLEDFGLNKSSFKPSTDAKDPIVMERISNFKLDPSKIEIIEDEDEDRPLELHVHCDRFLSAPSEHIEPLFREIPLYDEENFAELTEDPNCVPHFLSKCHIVTASQMEKIWTTHGKAGLLKLLNIGCLQRLTDFSGLEKGEAFEIIKEAPVNDWETWWAFSPSAFLDMIQHSKYAQRLNAPAKSAHFAHFLTNEAWLNDQFAWQLFDGPFIRIVALTPTDSQHLSDMFAFSLRFPKIMKGIVDPQELVMVPRWAVRVFQFMLELIGEPSKTSQGTNIIKTLLNQLLLAVEKLDVLKSTEKILSSAIKLAKSTVLCSPEVLYSAVEGSYDSKFKLAKQLSQELAKLPGADEVLKLVKSLQEASKSKKKRLYGMAGLSKRYHQRALVDISPDLKDEFTRDFILLTARPNLTPKELQLLKNIITKDLKDIPALPEPRDGEEVVINKNVPEKAYTWLTTTWLAGSHEAFLYVCETLNKKWGSPKTTEELIVELAQNDEDFVECALAVLKETRKAIQLIMRREDTLRDYKLKLINVQYEDIHSLALDDPHFFKPSFDLLVNPKNLAISYHWFQVKFKNEQGVDGGGPRRNWISKMLYAWIDPKRHFLKTFDNFIVPDIYVNYQVFYGLGRLIGKGIHQDAGLPFAFHPNFVKLLKEPDNEEFLLVCFNEWFAEELGNLKETYQMALASGPEEIEDMGLVSIEYWRLTDDLCPSTIGLSSMAAIERGCRVPIQKELSTGELTTRTLEQWILMEGSKYKESSRTVQVQQLSFKTCSDYTFTPKTKDDVKKFVDEAYDIALAQFKAGLNAFKDGLDVFIDISMFSYLKDQMMKEVFSPTLEIDVQSLIAAFQYQGGEGLTVAVNKPEELPEDEKLKLIEQSGKKAARITVVDAFKYAISKLTMEELHGFVAQLTGSRVTGLGGFQPNQFTAVFSQSLVMRPLIAEDACSAESDGQAEKGIKKTPVRLDLPFTASCSRSINMPLYATLEEVCLAVQLVAKASDEFPRT